MRSALGRGLGALISQPVVSISSVKAAKAEASGESISNSDGSAARTLEVAPIAPEPHVTPDGDRILFVPVTSIHPNPAQPRKTFVEQDLVELADSIKNMGVLQPVIVRPRRDGDGYEVVAGERRWRASQRAGLDSVPVIVKELSDWETLEIALVENVQRADLNPIEEAQAYQRLMDHYSLSQEDVADRIGKERATIANYLRLLKLAPEVQKFVQEGKVTFGHAKAILSVKDAAAQVSLAKKVVEEGLSVRAIEALASTAAVLDGQQRPALRGQAVGIAGSRSISLAFPDVVERLRRALGTKVLIRHQKTGRGRIEIEYFSEEELDRLVEQIAPGL